jgi:hypothetical protein
MTEDLSQWPSILEQNDKSSATGFATFEALLGIYWPLADKLRAHE